MYYSLLSSLLCCYGLFLILCGIVSVIFIGMKAKTALISGGTSGGLSLVIAYFAGLQTSWTPYAGFFLCTALLIVFSWRSAKTLFRFAEMIRENHQDTNGKGIAFLVISLMAVVTIFTLILQIVWLKAL